MCVKHDWQFPFLFFFHKWCFCFFFLVKPVVSSGQVSPHIAFRGHNTTLHFNISLASPDVTPGDITWSFTHRFLDISTNNITGSEHYQYSSSRRSLTLVNLTTNDTGVYQFTAVNPAGYHTDTVELSVQGMNV